MHKDEITDRLYLIAEAIDVILDRCIKYKNTNNFPIFTVQKNTYVFSKKDVRVFSPSYTYILLFCQEAFFK